MPSNKTFTIIILCGAVVISTWLLFKETPVSLTSVTKNSAIQVDTYKNSDEGTNDEWKKLLTDLSKSDQKIVDLTKNNAVPEDTTVTAQLAKDIFSTYLLTTKTGQPFTSQTADQVVQDVLASPIYTNSGGAVYLTSNLNVSKDDSRAAILRYKDKFNKALATRVYEIKNTDDPMFILNSALQTENELELAKIDPVIKSSQSFMNDLLGMEVPVSAVKVHLGVLNAMSDFLFDLQAMRMVFVDPVKGLTSIGEYNNDLNNFVTALKKINQYFEEN